MGNTFGINSSGRSVHPVQDSLSEAASKPWMLSQKSLAFRSFKWKATAGDDSDADVSRKTGTSSFFTYDTSISGATEGESSAAEISPESGSVRGHSARLLKRKASKRSQKYSKEVLTIAEQASTLETGSISFTGSSVGHNFNGNQSLEEIPKLTRKLSVSSPNVSPTSIMDSSEDPDGKISSLKSVAKKSDGDGPKRHVSIKFQPDTACLDSKGATSNGIICNDNAGDCVNDQISKSLRQQDKSSVNHQSTGALTNRSPSIVSTQTGLEWGGLVRKQTAPTQRKHIQFTETRIVNSAVSASQPVSPRESNSEAEFASVTTSSRSKSSRRESYPTTLTSTVDFGSSQSVAIAAIAEEDSLEATTNSYGSISHSNAACKPKEQTEANQRPNINVSHAHELKPSNLAKPEIEDDGMEHSHSRHRRASTATVGSKYSIDSDLHLTDDCGPLLPPTSAGSRMDRKSISPPISKSRRGEDYTNSRDTLSIKLPPTKRSRPGGGSIKINSSMLGRDNGDTRRRKTVESSWSERTRKLMISNRKMSVELEEIRYANLVATLPRAVSVIEFV
jgi:hypothetical protein